MQVIFALLWEILLYIENFKIMPTEECHICECDFAGRNRKLCGGK